MGGDAPPTERRRLPKRIVFGNLEGAVRKGGGGKEKEWTDCVKIDIRAFGIAGDLKATALKAEVWVETVTEGRRMFMAVWRKEEVDAARHRQEKREATKTEKLVIADGSLEFCEATPIGLVDEPNISLYGRETDRDLRSACRCVALFCVCYFSPNEQCGGGVWGVGGDMLPDFFFCSLFPVQQTTSGIGHRVK